MNMLCPDSAISAYVQDMQQGLHLHLHPILYGQMCFGYPSSLSLSHHEMYLGSVMPGCDMLS